MYGTEIRSHRSRLRGTMLMAISNQEGHIVLAPGNKSELAVGYSHPVRFRPPAGIEFEVPAPNRIVIRGIDKQLGGEVAADIRKLRKPEPYKGKGIRYEGEYVRKKAGKAAKGAIA